MSFTILRDTSEQDPLPFTRPTKPHHFAPPDTGDYSIEGLEKILRLERKKCPELWSCLGCRKEHFRSQLVRMTKFPIRMLIIEGSIADFACKPRYSGLTFATASARLMRWTAEFGVPIWFLGPRGPASISAIENLLQGIYDMYLRDTDFMNRWRTLMPGGN